MKADYGRFGGQSLHQGRVMIVACSTQMTVFYLLPMTTTLHFLKLERRVSDEKYSVGLHGDYVPMGSPRIFQNSFSAARSIWPKHGTKIETKIGEDGKAVAESHHTTSPNPKYHSNPHDHKIN